MVLFRCYCFLVGKVKVSFMGLKAFSVPLSLHMVYS